MVGGFCSTTAEVFAIQTIWSPKPKIFTIWLLQKKFAPLIYLFNAIPWKMTSIFPGQIDKLTLKFYED